MAPEGVEYVEQPYPVPTHLKVEQSIGPFPARFLLVSMCALALDGPFGVSTFRGTGQVLPAIGTGLLPWLALLPFAAWWLDPPAEHGLRALTGFVSRTVQTPPPPPLGTAAVYRMPTVNLETASDGLRREARHQWGRVLHQLTHPVKIIVRGRPITTMPVVDTLLAHPSHEANLLGEWLQDTLAQHTLIERERFLCIPAADEAELAFRTGELEKALKRMRLPAKRVDSDEVPLLRTLGWNPRATEARAAPEHLEEGWSESLVDGWWTRAYALGKLPPRVLTNWSSPIFNSDEPTDVAVDLIPVDLEYMKTWVCDVQIKRMESSAVTPARMRSLEQLRALRQAFEGPTVMPFEMAVTVVVRGASRDDLRARAKRVAQRIRGTGAKLNLLRWEQAAGLGQMDVTRVQPLRGRRTMLESGTVARTFPWSDDQLQIEGGVPWGEAGNRPCLFTPFVKANRGPHMCWYGTTNAGKSTGAHMLWSRLHLIQGVRLYGIDQDEKHEHCGRFLDYLHGRKLTPRDVDDVHDIVLHPDDAVAILDLSAIAEDQAGPMFAAWVKRVKAFLLAHPHPGAAIMFVDEATRVADDETGQGPLALRDCFQRGRRWWSSHALTQRPTDWFGTRTGRAVQGNADAWWCGAQQPREIGEVAVGLELTSEEQTLVRAAGIGEGLLVSGMRRVWLDLFEKLSPAEQAAFYNDTVVTPFDVHEDRRAS